MAQNIFTPAGTKAEVVHRGAIQSNLLVAWMHGLSVTSSLFILRAYLALNAGTSFTAKTNAPGAMVFHSKYNPLPLIFALDQSLM